MQEVQYELYIIGLFPGVDPVVRRKRELYPDDLRAIGHFEVIQHGPGEFALRAEARVPEALASPER